MIYLQNCDTCTEKLCEVSKCLVFLIFKSRQTKRNLVFGIINLKIAHHRNNHEYFECLHVITFSNKIHLNLRTAVPLNYGLSSRNKSSSVHRPFHLYNIEQRVICRVMIISKLDAREN